MKWFDQNPHGSNPGWRGEIQWDVHKFARSQFAGKFAQGGGIVPAMFAPSATEAMKAPWRKQQKYGSSQHLKNLEMMIDKNPHDSGLKSAYEKAKRGPGKASVLGRFAGRAMGAAFVGLPAFMTPGSGVEKARAVAGGMVGLAGWSLGVKAGASVGGAVGFLIPGIGTAIGAGAGALIGGMAGAIGLDEGFQALTRIPDRMVARERSRRKLDWIGDKTAFQTQRASTMRQQSMEMMNRGMMSARSLLGRESVMLHQ